jgi:hypothetical protein
LTVASEGTLDGKLATIRVRIVADARDFPQLATIRVRIVADACVFPQLATIRVRIVAFRAGASGPGAARA